MSKPSRQPRVRRPEAKPAPLAPPAFPPAVESAGDTPMPSVENAPACVFTPGPGIAAADVVEIALMFLLQISGSPVGVEKGALRTVAVAGFRVEQLSDSARRFMTPLTSPEGVKP